MLNTQTYKIAAICLFMTIFQFAYADWTLDEMMSKRDKKRTGVAKLNSRQRKNLQSWIRKNFVVRDSEVHEEQEKVRQELDAKKRAPTVSEVMQSGKYLKLTDNTVWEIHPADRATVQLWITPASIIVTTSNNPIYPYILKLFIIRVYQL